MSMKTSFYSYLAFLTLTLMLLSCGKTEQPEYPIALKLELPQSLAKGERRREKFMASADILTVTIETKEGGSFAQSYAKENWEKIILPGFEFPKSRTDKAEIKVEIRAKKTDGSTINDAVLKGSGTLYGKDIKTDTQNTLTIKLSLTVQPETWD